MSEREPELGLGVVAQVDSAAKRIAVEFPATKEKRLYALGTPVLKRVQFRAGETITTRDGASATIDSVEDRDGLLVYVAAGQRIPENTISDVTSVAAPQERLMAGQTDPNEVFDLRWRALEAQARFRQSDVRGFLGARVDLIPHQFYILHEVAARQIPRVLLADEVGLGKTIEACLVVQRLLAVGRARRVLILVPESLTHQWFVELLRRFNLWFTIYDEGRCAALEESDPGKNPFLSSQLALTNAAFLAGSETRREEVVAAGWDMVVVDEAHHLTWSPDAASPEYALVERLAQGTPGLLLLTATPTQLGLAGHFARLRLLDPNRYHALDAFVAETERFGTVAEIAAKIVTEKALTKKERALLQQIFDRAPERLTRHLDAVDAHEPGAREKLLRTLLDQYGTGRVMFRNTRAAMKGFPKRKFHPARLETTQVALLARIARELAAEETGAADSIRYAFKEDPRIEWLAGVLRAHRSAKVLLIARTARKVMAIEAALQEKLKVKSALFHEGLALVQRDRNAAWFAEPEGAQLLLCSEIGSEGRNFQFAHTLVLFDLPLNPGLVEQRIGRLDRIGQTQTIQVYAPFVAGSADECVVEWYHRGLDVFETPIHGGTEFQEAFRERLLTLAGSYDGSGPARERLDALITETAAFRHQLAEKMKRGRDRLLELNSFDAKVAAHVIERIRAVDADPYLRHFLVALLDHFGVRIKEHEEGDVFLDPSHAYIEGFPSIPPDGMLATFDRRRATTREDIRFLSEDHPLVLDAIDLLIDSPAGTTAFGTLAADEPNLLLEVVFVLETMADAKWHVDQFLAPTPIRAVVDLRGNDLTTEHDVSSLAGYVEESDLHRFLEQPGFNSSVLKRMLTAASAVADTQAANHREGGAEKASASIGADIERLRDLQKINPNVRSEEINLAQEQLEKIRAAIAQARLRLDSLRLIVAGPA